MPCLVIAPMVMIGETLQQCVKGLPWCCTVVVMKWAFVRLTVNPDGGVVEEQDLGGGHSIHGIGIAVGRSPNLCLTWLP